ncbi:hypothetical protein Alches_25660 [Alicyclobacillus hesperidum subsp. aegles]|nr:hypothetical protein Alches_25660 [Alicyclobacillus hesperidum subsp. aegles]
MATIYDTLGSSLDVRGSKAPIIKPLFPYGMGPNTTWSLRHAHVPKVWKHIAEPPDHFSVDPALSHTLFVHNGDADRGS